VLGAHVTMSETPRPARIAVIGAAWWSQGWHLPQLHRNPDSEIAAIMQRSEQPVAAAFLNLTLETKTQLRERYPGVPIYNSCEEMIADKDLMARLDGVIICTAHACHMEMGSQFLAAGKHVLMEKPMTVDVAEARELAAAAAALAPRVTFMVNNTANFRDKCFEARRLVEDGHLGDLHHVLCVMYSPLMFLFDDPANDGWVKPTGTMVQSDGSGNGFGWGQLSHLLGWVLFVGGLDVEEVTAITHRSEKSGADITDAALIRCARGISVSLSGGCNWPGNEHGAQKTGKYFEIKMFGSKGVLMYGGDDKDPTSGRLELRNLDGSESSISEGFLMENTEAEGNGPESLLHFIAACRGLPYRNGANQEVGLQAVRVLDAMYRSAASRQTEKAL
jgi:predicted dehydrogenase